MKITAHLFSYVVESLLLIRMLFSLKINVFDHNVLFGQGRDG